jgi:catechol 2,3-dioxygenase-like lactoylglutathione lyase family enzyme
LNVKIIGIQSLVYGVPVLEESRRFFEDFGLRLEEASTSEARFRLPEGSSVVLRQENDPTLPSSVMVGAGVREIIWGVEDLEALDKLAADLSTDREVRRDPDGTIHFIADFGLAMGLRVFQKKPVLCAPEPSNAPGHTVRLNQHRRWRQRAYPKGISHVVFAVPDFETGTTFMRERLGFRLSDEQVGFGMYLRADGHFNHHNFLLLNASAPLPGMDGKLRFHHANFAVEDLDEIMVGANHMERRGWEPSHFGLGRHRVDSALFYYLPCPAGGEAEYGADSDCVDDAWTPRRWVEPLFAYAHWAHNLPPFIRKPPRWKIEYLTDPVEVRPPHEGGH